jgi:hypothetical protein
MILFCFTTAFKESWKATHFMMFLKSSIVLWIIIFGWSKETMTSQVLGLLLDLGGKLSRQSIPRKCDGTPHLVTCCLTVNWLQATFSSQIEY